MTQQGDSNIVAQEIERCMCVTGWDAALHLREILKSGIIMESESRGLTAFTAFAGWDGRRPVTVTLVRQNMDVDQPASGFDTGVMVDGRIYGECK
jgi:hypothetical protein